MKSITTMTGKIERVKDKIADELVSSGKAAYEASPLREPLTEFLGKRELAENIMHKIEEIDSSIRDKIIAAAELYYGYVKTNFRKVKIKQMRIGTNHDGDTPTVLMIIAHENYNDLKEMKQIARKIELHFWKAIRFDCLIWTITDKGNIQTTITADFPFRRRGV